MAKINVVYRTDLSKRNRVGEFERCIVWKCLENENEHIRVANFRKTNANPNFRYALGHIKEV